MRMAQHKHMPARHEATPRTAKAEGVVSNETITDTVWDPGTGWAAKAGGEWRFTAHGGVPEPGGIAQRHGDYWLVAPFLSPLPQLSAVHAEVQPAAHAHDETGGVAAQSDTAGGAATGKGACLEDGVAGAAGHGEDEHGGRVA